MTQDIPCMIHKVVCSTKAEGRRVEKAWKAQEGTLGVERIDFRRGYGAVVKVYLPMPVGSMPDDCYAGFLRVEARTAGSGNSPSMPPPGKP